MVLDTITHKLSGVLRGLNVPKRMVLVSTTARSYTTDYLSHTEYKLKKYMPKARGNDILTDPRLNKGMAFSLQERQMLGIHGLLPPAFLSQSTQARRVIENLRRQPDDLARYVQLNALQDRNERLFYRVLCDNVEELMPVVYTPTVGKACEKFGFIYRKPKGLYITIHDSNVDHIYQVLSNWPERNVRAVVMTDGERILGLGDLGCYGMGIPVGKLSLYVALAGIQPKWCLPILLDVGTNNEKLLNDPYYIGCRHKRATGDEYDDFISNVMDAITARFGNDTLIQFEDFANHNAFRFLADYRDQYCTFNDDIQGTASVAVAGLLAANRVTNRSMADNKFLFFGAGEASLGIAKLTCMAIADESGFSFEEAKKRIWVMDSKGLLVKSRTNLTEHKMEFAQDYQFLEGLETAVKDLKPTGIIGAATVGGAFTENIIRAMASFNERPIIFALSNPTSKSECSAEEAYKFSDDRAVFASGSPFPAYECTGGKMYYPGQGNNAYIFPGVALGAILCGCRHITDEIFLMASETLAQLVTASHLEEGRVYPPLGDIREISVQIAVNVIKYCYKRGMAGHYPEPDDKEAFVRSQLYDYAYLDNEPELYQWPDELMEIQSLE